PSAPSINSSTSAAIGGLTAWRPSCAWEARSSARPTCPICQTETSKHSSTATSPRNRESLGESSLHSRTALQGRRSIPPADQNRTEHTESVWKTFHFQAKGLHQEHSDEVNDAHKPRPVTLGQANQPPVSARRGTGRAAGALDVQGQQLARHGGPEL